MNQQHKIESLKRRYGRTPSSGPAKGPMGGHGPGARMAAVGKGMPKNSRQTITALSGPCAFFFKKQVSLIPL